MKLEELTVETDLRYVAVQKAFSDSEAVIGKGSIGLPMTVPAGNGSSGIPLSLEGFVPVARSLSEFKNYQADDPSELLKFRFLCKTGGLLLVGPTGIGKSSFAMQCMISWALGKDAFGITPSRRLKSLLIQAENDDGDIAEMRDGVAAGLKLSAEDQTQAMSRIFVCQENSKTSAAFFQEVVRPLLKAHQPDLLWIDPALAVLGGEANAQKDVGAFLRNQLNPLLHEFGCGAVIVHHTNKPTTGLDKKSFNVSDMAYSGAGSAEWANWARAVLAIKGTGVPNVYELWAGKRGSRIGWKHPDNVTKAYSKFIAHSMEPGVICWHSSEAPLESAQSGVGKTKFDVLKHVPPTNAINKKILISKCQNAGIGKDRARSLIDELIADGELKEVEVRRPRMRPEVHVQRTLHEVPVKSPSADIPGVFPGNI